MVHELPCTILLNAVGLIYCSGCPAGYKALQLRHVLLQRQVVHARTAPSATLTVLASSTAQAALRAIRVIVVRSNLQALLLSKAAPPETGGACQNGSKCTLNSAGYIYCANCPAGYTGFRCEKPPAAGKACTSDSDCTAPQQCLVDAANQGPVAGPRNQKCQKQVTCPAGQAKCGFTYYDLAPSFSRSISANTLCCPAGQGCFAPDAGAPSRCFASLGCPSGEVSCGEGITYGYKSNPDNVCCAAGQICSRGGGGGGSASYCVTPPATPPV